MKAARWMMFLGVAMALWLPAVEAQAQAPNATHDATYDASQPGADDARVQDGFAAYQAGDFTRAFDIWLPLAEAGNAEAQFRVGRLYDRGEGVRQDTDGMIGWYTLAANQGHVSAAYNLGNHFYDTGGSIEMYQKAVEMLKVAASENVVSAQYNLALAYALLSTMRINEGLSGQFSDSYMWFFVARENGHEDVDDTLLRLDTHPYTVAQDRTEGIKKMREWFKNHPRSN